MEDGGCYRAVRTIDRFLRSFKSAKVDADVLEMEAALALSTHMKIDYPGCHLHQNVNIRNYSDKGQVAQQLDATHALLQRAAFHSVLGGAGRRFPENLVQDCLMQGIVPVFPSGARFVAKGLEILRKMV